MYTPIPISNRNHSTSSNGNVSGTSPHNDSSNNALAAFGISATDSSQQGRTGNNGPNNGSGFNSLLSTFGIRQSSNVQAPEAPDNTDNGNLQVSNSHLRLPITISLGANNSNSTDTNPNQHSNALDPNNNNNTSVGPNAATTNSDNTVATVKNIRHYVYSANQPNADSLLHLDLPSDTVLPATLSEKELRNHKDKNGLFSIRLTPFIDNVSTTNQGLYFDPIIRTAGPGSQLVIGRYTERVREAISKLPENYHPVVFKSKVISRTHGCFKVDSQGNWFVKDVKSSSGTFLNHQRLAPASTMSQDILLHDGDVLQLGMDFRGGTEEIYRCVKMRIELNKSWKRKANAFNKEALQKIKDLQKLTNGGIEEEDCSICLSKIKPCQAIFISPCSHSWHFHCVRRLVMLSYPQFVCPNCRSACDLEATLESSDSEDYDDEDEDNEMEPNRQENMEDNTDENTDNDSENSNNQNRNNREDEFDIHNNSHNNIATTTITSNTANNNSNQIHGNLVNQLGVQLDDPKNDIDMED